MTKDAIFCKCGNIFEKFLKDKNVQISHVLMNRFSGMSKKRAKLAFKVVNQGNSETSFLLQGDQDHFLAKEMLISPSILKLHKNP